MTLREILKKHGIKQKIVADALNIHVNAISRYDDLTKRTVNDLIVISKASGLTIKQLLTESLNMELYKSLYNSHVEQSKEYEEFLIEANKIDRSDHEKIKAALQEADQKNKRLEMTLNLALDEITRLKQSKINLTNMIDDAKKEKNQSK